MPCGKKPLVKKWDHPRQIRVIKPSRYEQNEPSVKLHWKQVLRDLELSYKDEKFWESSADTVHDLVGPVVFKRITKIFNLPPLPVDYQPCSDNQSVDDSENFYESKNIEEQRLTRATFSNSDYEPVAEEEEDQLSTLDPWTESESSRPPTTQSKKPSPSKSLLLTNKSYSTSLTKFNKSIARLISSRSKSFRKMKLSLEETASTEDDIEVHVEHDRRDSKHVHKNPYHEMLYCNESETDMIKWKSKYKQKAFEVSASDEFSKRAEIMTKKIAKEFYEWWVSLGTVEFKSEIRRPEDIEDLFQVWFDEQASRGIVLDPRILPCVLQSIADYVGVPELSCPRVLARQVAYDIHAETSPAHVMAFGTCLPQKMKHIPPNNKTEKIWHSVKIPDDLRTMSCVWDGIQHLTSTKTFQSWLQVRPHLPMPPCLSTTQRDGEKKQLFVVPSDFVMHEVAGSTQELSLPVSQFTLELKEVLSKLMNQN